MGRKWDDVEQVYVYTWPDPVAMDPLIKKALLGLEDACEELGYIRPCSGSTQWDPRRMLADVGIMDCETPAQFRRRATMSVGICRGICKVLPQCRELAAADKDAIGIIAAEIRPGPPQ